MAVCQEFDPKVENGIIPHIAYGFAGGIGNTGSVCGAVIGAVMAIGLKLERGDTVEEALRALKVVREFRRRFETETETISCRELTGADLSTEKGGSQYMRSDIP